MIQQARESGEFIVTRAEVQRGGVEVAVMNFNSCPYKKTVSDSFNVCRLP